mgnify:CR=1 FL=1
MIILRRPIITEKSMRLAKGGQYSFEIDKAATKPMVAKAVADKFSVKVTAVKIINIRGQVKQQKSVRKSFQAASIKKAMVQVGKGQKIAIFETPKEEAVVTTAEGEPIKIKEKKSFLRGTKVKVEQSAVGAAPTTQRKVITGK